MVSVAKTGSGKTLGFLVPGYCRCQPRGIQMLVLAPTRELATQIHAEAAKFAPATGFAAACAYGGAPKREQLRDIREGCSVLIATPGRLNDFLESRQVWRVTAGEASSSSDE